MISKILEALIGSRKRVIAVIPSTELAILRENAKAKALNKANLTAATAHHFFEYVNTVSAERLAVESEKVTSEAKESFLKTERNQLLKAEFNWLEEEGERIISDLLASHGIESTGDYELDVSTGEVSREEEISHA